jgi:hypothetical protein
MVDYKNVEKNKIAVLILNMYLDSMEIMNTDDHFTATNAFV